MTLSNFTPGQKLALYTSLKNQVSPKTNAEKALYSQLREDLADIENEMLILDGYAKQSNMDTFGDTYRNRWSKIQVDKDGEEFVRTSYLGKCYLYK